MLSVLLLTLSACGGNSSSNNTPGSECPAWPADIPLSGLHSNSMLNSVVALPDCDLLIAGYYGSTNISENLGNSTGFVRRLHLNQLSEVEQLWEMPLDTEGSASMDGISESQDGIITWGQTSGQAFARPNQGKTDVVIYRLAEDGSIIEGDQFGTPRPDALQHFYLTGSNMFFTVGNHAPYIPTNYVETWEDPFIATGYFDPSGITSLLVSDENSVTQDLATASHYDGDNDSVYVGLTVLSGVARGIWLRKLDTAGVLQWQRRLTDSPYDFISAIHGRGDGAIMAIGTTYSPSLGETFHGGGHGFIARIDPDNGDLLDSRRFGTEPDDWVTAAIHTPDNRRLVLFDSLLAEGGYLSHVIDLEQPDARPTAIPFPGNNLQTTTVASVGEQLIIGGYYLNAAQNQKQAYLKSIAMPDREEP